AALAPLWVRAVGRPEAAPFLGTWAGLVLALLVAACACTDLAWRKIPNWATYPALLWAVLLNAFAALAPGVAGAPAWPGVDPTLHGAGAPGLLGHVGLGWCLLGAVACFVVMFFIYRLAGGGAGDVKLAAALGALLGLEGGLTALVFTYIAAGVAALAW